MELFWRLLQWQHLPLKSLSRVVSGDSHSTEGKIIGSNETSSRKTQRESKTPSVNIRLDDTPPRESKMENANPPKLNRPNEIPPVKSTPTAMFSIAMTPLSNTKGAGINMNNRVSGSGTL
jgi:hypothetical protein